MGTLACIMLLGCTNQGSSLVCRTFTKVLNSIKLTKHTIAFIQDIAQQYKEKLTWTEDERAAVWRQVKDAVCPQLSADTTEPYR